MLKSQRDKVFQWLPNTLDGRTIPKFRAGEYGNEPPVPSISLGSLSEGGRSQFYDAPLREVVDGPDSYLEWGQYHKATFSVHIRTLSPEDTNVLASEFIRACFQTRFNLVFQRDKVRFVDILTTRPLLVRDEHRQKLIYRAIVDIEFEYELSYPDSEDVILRFNMETNEDLKLTYGKWRRTYEFGLTALVIRR